MSILNEDIIKQLKLYFEKITDTIEIISFLDECDKSKELDNFLKEIDSISDKVNYTKKNYTEEKELTSTNNITRPVSFTILKNGNPTGINFYGIPGGHEFNSFILAILGLAELTPPLDETTSNKIKSINNKLNIEIFMSLNCNHCPDVVQAINKVVINNDNLTANIIDGNVYPKEMSEKEIMATPSVYSNGTFLFSGAKSFNDIVDLLVSAK